jgi:SAM-dependent methyltransferase
MKSPDWSGSSGDIWARRWRDTDRALAQVGAGLDQAILQATPEVPFRALDIGCGPGTTSLALGAPRRDAEIVGCDISPSLIAIAKERSEGVENVRYIVGDAAKVAGERGPFDLLVSRHGVMFFDDPVRAFANLRAGTARGGRLVFSCFREWSANPWAAELASAAAGRELPPPGREPSGFAFADPAYVTEILSGAGWSDAEPRPLDFDYDAGSFEEALSFLAELGPAARVLEELDDDARAAALQRMRSVVERHQRGGRITFGGAAWIWSARSA